MEDGIRRLYINLSSEEKNQAKENIKRYNIDMGNFIDKNIKMMKK